MIKAFQAGKPWTSTAMEQLKFDYQSGMPLLQLAEKHGRSGSAVRREACGAWSAGHAA
jgi:hypothetical protein